LRFRGKCPSQLHPLKKQATRSCLLKGNVFYGLRFLGGFVCGEKRKNTSSAMNTKYILHCWRCFADHELYLFPFRVFLVLHEKDDPILKGRVF